MKKTSLWIAAAATLAGLALPGAASAQSTWNLVSGGGCTQNGTNAGNFGNTYGCTSSGATTATAYAYSTQNGSSGAGTLQNINTATQYANAWLSPQGSSGFGVANRTEGLNISAPEHAVDNNPTGSFDMIVLNFSSAIVLSQIGVGWTNFASGADLTIMRWDGTGNPATAAGTASVTTGGNGTLARSGWTLVSSLADVLGDNSAPLGGNARNTYADTTRASSWWMISAFNTALNSSNLCYTNNSRGTVAESSTAGGLSSNNGVRCDDGDDAFKLNYLVTTSATLPPQGRVPEPASLALVAAALLGVGAARRRSAAAKA